MPDVESVLDMLAQCKNIALTTTIAYTNLQSHPAFKQEGLPELLRAQEQNAMALIVQAEKIWRFIQNENSRK